MDPGDEPVSVVLDGVIFPTVEHGYVAAKVTDAHIREEIRLLPTAGKAKRFLKKNGLVERAGWREINLGIMENLVRQKFSNPKLAAMLLATGDEELIEGNTWHDTFFGVDLETGEGQNHLGRILMKVRTELKIS